MNKKQKTGLWLISMMTVFLMTALLIHGAIPQSQSYHAFADQRNILGIPNFFNVLSNVPFFLVGLIGVYQCTMNEGTNITTGNRRSYQIFFCAVMLIGIGSGYYHLRPGNENLVWDRLPMTVAFMALMSIIISEFVSTRLASQLLIPLLSIGILSVLYWYWSESVGVGDLRPYLLIQFLPILIIPVILICFESIYVGVSGYWYLILAYVAAKVFEYFDSGVFSASGIISGHSVKHVVAALGIYCLLLSFGRRCR